MEGQHPSGKCTCIEVEVKNNINKDRNERGPEREKYRGRKMRVEIRRDIYLHSALK